jgi:hypothetical protein
MRRNNLEMGSWEYVPLPFLVAVLHAWFFCTLIKCRFSPSYLFLCTVDHNEKYVTFIKHLIGVLGTQYQFLPWTGFIFCPQNFCITLAARGLEELFFQLCCCVSFWFWWEIGFGFIYYVLMYLEYNTVVVLC